MTQRLVVIASDEGKKLQEILNACENGTLDAEIVALVADKKCPAIHVAEAAGIPIIFHTWGPYKIAKKVPGTYKRDLAVKVWMYQPDLIVLAGWLRDLADGFLENYPRQVVSVHPALSGEFPDPFAIAKAFDAYQRNEIHETGVTVHYAMRSAIVEEDILLQETVSIHPDETIEALKTRILEVEKRLLLQALQDLLAVAA